jgi:hypothetical protein
MKTIYWYIGGVGAAVLVSAVLAWVIFASSPAPATNSGGSSVTYGSSNENATNVTPTQTTGGTNTNTPTSVQTSQQKVFKISDGPVAGATFVETLNPTTTMARYVMADNGHAFDFVVDSPGAAQKTLSNTTVPGAVSAQWAAGSAILQYLDGTTPKTVYLGLSQPGGQGAAHVTFYPDGIVSVAASPDGSAVAYLVRSQSGINGYTAKPDGTNGKFLFSLPLSQAQIEWPSANMLLVYSSAAASVPGIAFTVDAKSGTLTPLVYAPGLTANADSSFAHVLYQTIEAGSAPRTYSHNVSSGTDIALSFSPIPEKCTSYPSPNVVLCAASLSYTPSNYLDLWYQGAASAADSLIAYNLATGAMSILATPGSTQDGGVGTDMLQIAVSQDGHYALFVSKYDRSLWGVRLPQ